jgi:membrane protein DedA with SNARE-associated domain
VQRLAGLHWQRSLNDICEHFCQKNQKKNVDMLGKFFNKHTKLSIPLLITYAFFPIPSNNVYIAAGIAKINIRILALSFFIGRLISYTFWVAATHRLATSLEGIFQAEYANTTGLIIEVLSFLLIYIIIKIPWVTILSRLDTQLTKKKK